MKERPGQILLHILIGVGLLMTVCTHILRWSLQTKTMRQRVIQRECDIGALEAARSKMWGCLSDNGYPGSSCVPNAAQRACIPEGISAAFSGTPPECRIGLADK